MNKQLRRNIFETNSSSTHTLVLANTDKQTPRDILNELGSQELKDYIASTDTIYIGSSEFTFFDRIEKYDGCNKLSDADLFKAKLDILYASFLKEDYDNDNIYYGEERISSPYARVLLCKSMIRNVLQNIGISDVRFNEDLDYVMSMTDFSNLDIEHNIYKFIQLDEIKFSRFIFSRFSYCSDVDRDDFYEYLRDDIMKSADDNNCEFINFGSDF